MFLDLLDSAAFPQSSVVFYVIEKQSRRFIEKVIVYFTGECELYHTFLNELPCFLNKKQEQQQRE